MGRASSRRFEVAREERDAGVEQVVGVVGDSGHDGVQPAEAFQLGVDVERLEPLPVAVTDEDHPVSYTHLTLPTNREV